MNMSILVNLLNVVMAMNWRVFTSDFISNPRFERYVMFSRVLCDWAAEGNIWGGNNTVEKITRGESNVYYRPNRIRAI